jgi:hypothetical protein
MRKKATALLVSTGVAGLIAGGVLMTGLSANAADDTGTASTSSVSTGTSSYGGSYGGPSGTAPQGQPGANPNAGDPGKPQRSDEKLLTGTTLAKVTAAVKAKYPDATIQRVETDSDGVYEAHLLVSGKPVTVEVDKSFTITGTEAAPTGAPDGDGPAGQAPAA